MKKEARFDLKIIIPIIVLICVLMYGVFATVTVDSVEIISGNESAAGVNIINYTAKINVTISMDLENASVVNITFDARYLNFTLDSNRTGVASNFTNVTTVGGNTTISWITSGNGPFDNTFAFNVTLEQGVEEVDSIIRVTVYNATATESYILLDDLSNTVNIDNKAPVVSYNSPNQTNSSTNLSVRLNFSVSDLNAQTCFLYVQNLSSALGTSVSADVAWGQKANDTVANLNNTGFVYTFTGGDGEYAWNVECNDTVGHYATNVSYNRTILIDTHPPISFTFNISNETHFTRTEDFNATNNESGGSILQGETIYAYFNFTDNTTGWKTATLQVYNTTKATGKWMNVSSLNTTAKLSDIYNLSYTTCSVKDCYQSGQAVAMRVIGIDYAGNYNYTYRNLSVQINDTIAPEITSVSISGGANGTNITTATFALNWTLSEWNNISWLAYSIDSKTTDSDSYFFNYSIVGKGYSDSEMGELKNGSNKANYRSTSLLPTGETKLGNGTHSVSIHVMDNWGNTRLNNYTFTVDTSTPDDINITFSKNLGASHETHPGNISIYGYANVTVNFTGSSRLRQLEYYTTCNSTWVNITNNTAFQPFNGSEGGCSDQDAAQTITVRATNFAGASKTYSTTVGLDNTVPVVTINEINESATTVTTANIAGYEFSSLVIAVNYSITEYTSLSSLGYYLDGNPYVELLGGGPVIDHTISYRNITNMVYGGKHKLTLQVNDSVGNTANSTTYTFYVAGPVNITAKASELNASLETTTQNITITYANGTAVPSSQLVVANSTIPTELAIHFEFNSSPWRALNVTIGGINASKVMWEYLNLTVVANDTAAENSINTNFSATVLKFVMFNGTTSISGVASINDFISDTNAYFGRVEVPYELNQTQFIGMWFDNESDFASGTVLSQCSGRGASLPYRAIETEPCYNRSGDGETTVFVPYFSIVAVLNDSNASTVAFTPADGDNYNESSFIVNLTISGDVSSSGSCAFRVNTSGYYAGTDYSKDTWTTMATSTGTSPKECLSSYPISLANGTGTPALYNLTVNVTDPYGNQNITYFIFNVTDIHIPTLVNVTNSSIDSTSATIGVTSNEYINASVTYLGGTLVAQNSPFTTKKPTISLSDLSSSTVHNYTVTVCDRAGNCNTSSQYNLTTSEAAAATGEAAASTGTSGGGGATVAAASNVAAKQSQVWNKVSAGESITMAVSNENIALTEIKVDVQNEVMSVSLEASSLKDKPSEAAETASSKVYQYLEVKPANLADADISSAKINFEVTTAWLTTNNVANDDIALLRYTDDKWDVLPTKIVGTTPYNVKYEATTEGFSYFAIGSKSGVGVEPEEVPEGVTTTTVPGVLPEEEKKPIVTPPAAAANYVWLVVLAVVVIIVLIYVGMKKKKK